MTPAAVYPDAADKDMLNSTVAFDFISIQFYNNACGADKFNESSTPNPFNLGVWDTWAKTASKNKNVKLLLGIPASLGSAPGGGYVSGSQLSSVIAYSKKYSSFAGVMMWDISTLFANSGYPGLGRVRPGR